MELRHLRYAIAIAEAGTVTRAAERLRMQQPPLSQQLRDLERELGFSLFERSRRGVEPTAAGVVFLEEARRVLDQAERAKERAAQTAAGIEGTLAIGFTSSAAMGRIAPEMVAAYRALYPRVQLSFSDGNAGALTQAVLRSSLDVALVRAPVLAVPEIRCDKLLEESMLVALASSHPLARTASRRQRSLSLEALVNEPFILVRRPGAPGMGVSNARHKAQNSRLIIRTPPILVGISYSLRSVLYFTGSRRDRRAYRFGHLRHRGGPSQIARVQRRVRGDGLDGCHKRSRGFGLAQVLEQHDATPERADRIGDALAHDVEGRSVNRLEHRWIAPLGIDVAGWGDPQAAGERRRQIAQDVGV